MGESARECERERERDIYKTRTLSTMGKKSPLHGISVVSGVNLVHFYFILFFHFILFLVLFPFLIETQTKQTNRPTNQQRA